MKNGILKRRLTHIAGSASAVILLGGMLTSCKDDLLVGMPDWLGSSIYEELESRGNFTETLKLINGQEEDFATMLRKTGSKTLFVADDASWAEFYKSNPWGVTCFEDLTASQKKLLFKGNMIDQAYLVELLGNSPAKTATDDPLEGNTMRRVSSVDLSDSIPVMYSYQFPEINEKRVDDKGRQIDYWSEVRGMDTITIFSDDQVAPMIHFMPKFMQNNRISDDDVAFMTNGGIKSNTLAFINGKVVKEADVTCQNGYIHVLEGVAIPNDNMAKLISNNPKFSMYSRLMNRFSYPKWDRTLSDRYNDGDSAFVLRYFNKSQNHGLQSTDKGVNVPSGTLLEFDPGWNRYMYHTVSDLTYENDAAAMLVPTDDAMKYYLDHDGADIKERYGTAENNGYDAWDNAPDAVVIPLLNNTMKSSLKSTLPSVFSSVTNSASDPMGVKKEDIDYVHWACNGVVYETNKVYVAPDYVSVFYPCIIRNEEDLHIMYTTIENDDKVDPTKGVSEGLKAYLSSTGTKYSFIIPTDRALKNYYDPVSRNRIDAKTEDSTAVNYEFFINSQGNVAAYAYLVDWSTLDDYGRGTVTDEPYSKTPAPDNKNSKGAVFNHMKDIINSSMAMGLFTPGQKFYTSKLGSPIVVDWDGNDVVGVAGSFQHERGYFIPVTSVFDKSEVGNGRSYIVDMEPIQSTTLSPYMAITDPNRPEFESFASLLMGCSFIGTNDGAGHATMDNCLKNLDNYHYTIYVPTSESIDPLIAEHKLPTSDDQSLIQAAIVNLEEAIDLEADQLKELDEPTKADSAQLVKLNADLEYLQMELANMTRVMENFVSYHIQDNAVYVEGANQDNQAYESACLDTVTTRFVKIRVNYTLGGQMKITDSTGKVHTVDSDVNNILTRQYYFNGASLKGEGCEEIYSSAHVVVHMIDSPMLPYAEGDPLHPNCGLYSPATYAKVMSVVDQYYTPEPDDVPTENPVKRHKR